MKTKIKLTIKRILFACKLFGRPNWHNNIDEPTFWQWIYEWRLSLKTAYDIARIIYDK